MNGIPSGCVNNALEGIRLTKKELTNARKISFPKFLSPHHWKLPVNHQVFNNLEKTSIGVYPFRCPKLPHISRAHEKTSGFAS